MGINGEMQEIRAEQEAKREAEMEQARIERHAERIAREKAIKFIVNAMVHECRDREPTEYGNYEDGFHDGFTACLQALTNSHGMSWDLLMDKVKAELGLYRCP